jgi:NhaP-type Na+/H+ or K+/H+ antiporter
MLLVSVGVLSVTRRQRVRWDAALIFGVGTGLLADEAGLLLVGIPYNDPISLLLLVSIGVILFAGSANAALRDGTREFHILDKADILTMLAILLSMAGVLYLDRPLIPIVEAAGGVSWACALVLFTLVGKRHFLRIWRYQN